MITSKGLVLLVAGLAAASPPYRLYSQPLPIPQTASPILVQNVNGRTIEYYELTISNFEHQVYNYLGTAKLIGYNGTAPGPTFKIRRGVETVIRVTNNASNPSSMHLHGSDSHAVWDGWADDLIPPGSFKDYYYGNSQTARPLFYHDHVEAVTARDCYFGQQGIYLIQDPDEDSLQLPNGNYDIPLGLTDKTYKLNGDLSPPNGPINFFGDTIHVNEMPWPYFNAEPRKYRFRIYDLSLSRPYNLTFQVMKPDGTKDVIAPFQIIASDGGLFKAPVTATNVLISTGERYEILFDFAQYQGRQIIMKNTLRLGFLPELLSPNTDKVMMFIVGSSVTDDSNNNSPASLATNIDFPPPRKTVDHSFNFQMGGGDVWTINGVTFDDPVNRVLARPPQGTVELWSLRHTGGLGVHPVHIHLVNFQVISRTGRDRGLAPYETAGLKDVVLLQPGETVLVNAFYGPWNGMYMFHCHNLVHEDHLMLDVMNVTRMAELGYDSTAAFGDPTDPKYAARPSSAEAYKPSAISSTIQALGSLNAYAPGSSLAAAESAYYLTAGYSGDLSTATTTTTATPVSSGVGFS